ncbi:TOG array regulator of axonemal microtubules protein 1-like [Anarhichas minor]|uniref:TOG array regulator of axonemal microtubules protein 1-like n=1 Tax=Anarhichas minor TaxID=65739 RepID=UPI003F733DD5
MEMPSCKLAKITEEDRSPSPDFSLSSVDMQTELRAISQLTPTPPPTAATRRPTRLPVMIVKPGQAEKDVADGCKLQTAQSKVEKLMERLDKFQLLHHPSPQPPAAPRRTKAVTAKVRLPPAPPNRSQPHCAVNPTVPAPPVPPNKIRPHRGPQPCSEKADTGQEDLQPLVNPTKSLSLCFKQLTSDDWEKNLDGLKSVRALARHHPALLQSKLHEVCLILIKVVNNLRSSVASFALDTVGELHVHLGRAMDAEAEWTGRALLLKLSKTTNVFVRQRANLALDALVKGCCPGRVMSILFNTGLSHTCIAVRESTAQHLQQLVDVVGEDQILTSGKIFTERFLTAVSEMAVDAAPEVRRHGQMMIQGIDQQRKLIPEKYLRPVQKIFQKARQ